MAAYAQKRTQAGRRMPAQNRTAARTRRSEMVEGSAARRLREEPYRPPVRRTTQAKAAKAAVIPIRREPKELSEQAKRNRERAEGLGKGYVLFLAVVSALILLTCVNYLRLQTKITASMKAVASLESELTQLKEDNDAYYSQVTSNVDLNSVKKTAIGRLGMRYPTEDQIVTYETEGRSYVRQFQDVPGA